MNRLSRKKASNINALGISLAGTYKESKASHWVTVHTYERNKYSPHGKTESKHLSGWQNGK